MVGLGLPECLPEGFVVRFCKEAYRIPPFFIPILYRPSPKKEPRTPTLEAWYFEKRELPDVFGSIKLEGKSNTSGFNVHIRLGDRASLILKPV